MAAANNMLAAEGEIGAGRDVTTIVPGGFTSAGAINGNLRARSGAVFLDGALGTTTAVASGTGPPATVAYTEYTPADVQSYYTIEKKVGTAAQDAGQLLTLQYTDCIVNTLNISANSGALSTFSAGIMTAGETYLSAPLVDDTATGAAYSLSTISNDLLVFHGGRIMVADSGLATTNLVENDQFQSLEVVINNNIQGDEWTIRPSRFLHSFTEGIRDVEVNMTVVFGDYRQYLEYTYGATAGIAGAGTAGIPSGYTGGPVAPTVVSPGYTLYTGQIDFTLANWQLSNTYNLVTGNGTKPSNPQALRFYLPQVVIAGFPVTLATGRIVVTTNGRATKPIGSATPIITADALPSAAAF